MNGSHSCYGAGVLIAPDSRSGLDRGMWEAPRWAFFVAAGVVVALAALYAARRAGWLRLPRRGGGGR
jgi:hypothetical protein